jgi:hypothetical protein
MPKSSAHGCVYSVFALSLLLPSSRPRSLIAELGQFTAPTCLKYRLKTLIYHVFAIESRIDLGM